MSQAARDRRPDSPWRSAPLLWFVAGLPLVVVVAAFVTLGIAIHGSDDVVRDDFRRDGLAIHADPARDAAAAALGVTARMSVDPASRRLRIRLDLAAGEQPASLLVLLSHATRAEYDRMLRLQRAGDDYEAVLEKLPAGHWYVEITPPDRAWRLKGDFRGAATDMRLAAAGVS